MTTYKENPFSDCQDRQAIWDMLVGRDIDAFLTKDWSMIENDFLSEGFYGIDGNKNSNLDNWTMTFPDLPSYKTSWLSESEETAKLCDTQAIRRELFNASRLRIIDFKGDYAVAHKEIKGAVTRKDGIKELLDWQTLYVCRKVNNKWHIASFIGYIPSTTAPTNPIEDLGAGQHITAGPYSPVLKIHSPKEIIVISGQAPVNIKGEVVGETIEEQTRVTLDNCLEQLQNAGCDFSNVFKVNVYLADLDEWPRFNEIYKQYMSQPYPARAAIQAGLLYTFKVEIEMWAAK